MALATLALLTSGARAETVFPVYGGKGDYTEQYRCPKGQVIVGFSGKTGDWVDRISLTCGRFVAPSYTLAAMKRMPGRGGLGGAPNAKDCPVNAAVRQIIISTVHNSYLLGLDFYCFRPSNGSPDQGGEFGGHYPFWEHRDIVGNFDIPKKWGPQECPGVEYAVGLTIRFGKHVNAVGLICGALIAEGQPAKEWLPGEENQIDRPGSDFRSFPVASGDPAQCRAACLLRGNDCAAWTYVKPGFQGSEAMCYLKNAVPATVRNPCCISGLHPKIKRALGDPPPTGPNLGDVTPNAPIGR